MDLDQTIGFIGAGNMASALIRGLVGAGVDPERIGAADPHADRLADLSRDYGIRTSTDNRELAGHSQITVLAVKPQVARQAVTEIADALAAGTVLVSICAGISTATLEGWLPESVRVVRVMPNTPALVGAGASALCAGSRATAADMTAVDTIFSAVGLTVTVDEHLIDAVTGVSGSGPAYVFLILEAMADAGVKLGLPRPIALRLAAQTVVGAARMVLETGAHPAELKDQVTSPGGATIAALHALEQGGLRSALIEAVAASAKRSAELGRASEDAE